MSFARACRTAPWNFGARQPTAFACQDVSDIEIGYLGALSLQRNLVADYADGPAVLR